MFDNDTFNLVGKNCNVLVGGKHKKPQGMPFPDEIFGLIEKSCLFKVEVKNVVNSRFQLSYRVKKVADDAGIIKRFQQLQPISGKPELGCLDLMLQYGDIAVECQMKNSVEIAELGFETQRMEVGKTVPNRHVAGDSEEISPGKRLFDVAVDDLDSNSSNHKLIKIIKKRRNEDKWMDHLLLAVISELVFCFSVLLS